MFLRYRPRAQFIIALALSGIACSAQPDPTTVTPGYDTYTSRLIQLSADQDGDGRIDQWTYLDGNRPLRGEKDSDADGRIDRWEYFGPQAELVVVGTSSRGDGIEDTWTHVARANGEGRIDVSIRRDRSIDRREYYIGETLVRAEIDSNADGRTDRWERYEQGVLREAQLDTSLTALRADRRLLYDPQGRFVGAEADDDRDGVFQRLSPTTMPTPGGRTK